ncbi:4Fe-4S dicluster domain-containing protein [Fundidesulfovibrio terrae]|uniref:4Fe-4S dicluster domain-containing protein n=1 Tax=Fundidesulfovibrio terrae TaxID=2922866 RepID=UPI001FAE7D82|nr:4Fe-4S dicluster domain-containing protein [Fundidesulfovibrio terrae]
MNVISLTASRDLDFIARVEKESGQKVSLCYQCGNCTAGCPYTFVYDIPVHQVMRLLQAGQKQTLLSCRSIWLCATCQSCTTRCPNNIDVAHVMDTLRHMARREGQDTEYGVKSFVDSFLESVEKNGRAFEMGLLVSFIMKTGRFWTDVDLAPKILPKGKLSPLPHKVKNPAAIAKIFERFRQEGHK